MEMAREDARRATRTSLLALLTGGRPTAGVTAPDRILTALRDANREKPRIGVYAIGIGQGGQHAFFRGSTAWTRDFG